MRGATPFELVHGKVYRGSLALFGELTYAFLKTALQSHAKWHKALLFSPTGCSRAHTLLNVHFVLFFTVFSASLQCCPGGEGGAGTTDVTDGTRGGC